MKVNEIIVENELDEALPGTSSNWFNKAKQITGLGAGAKEMRLIATRTKQVYNGWLAFVPVLQKSGKLEVDPNKPQEVEDLYRKYLVWFVSKNFKIRPNDQNETKLINDFEKSVKANLSTSGIRDGIEKLASELYVSRSVQAPDFGKKNPKAKTKVKTKTTAAPPAPPAGSTP